MVQAQGVVVWVAVWVGWVVWVVGRRGGWYSGWDRRRQQHWKRGLAFWTHCVLMVVCIRSVAMVAVMVGMVVVGMVVVATLVV